MNEDVPHAHGNGALIAEEKDPETNHSSSRKQQRWGLLTNICKVNTVYLLYSMILSSTGISGAMLELQHCICHSYLCTKD